VSEISERELDELREARRLLAQEHHAKQMARHGDGAPLCICVHCEAYRASLTRNVGAHDV
jgi:hypothetical protein